MAMVKRKGQQARIQRSGKHPTATARRSRWLEELEPRLLLSTVGAGGTVQGLVGTPAVVASSYSQVNGAVNDNGGRPLAGATIMLVLSGSSTGPAAQGTTDSNGQYSFNVTPGNYIARASKDGYQVAYSATFVVGSATATAPTLSLTALNTVTGLVTDKGGNPLAGASVSIVVVGSSTPTTGTTDSTGRYTFSVVAGNYVVRASKTGYQYAYSATITVGSGTTTVPTLQLAALSTVTGLVTDKGGNPLAGASVSIVVVGSSTSTTGTTDSTGRYTFSVAAGNYVVRASKTGYQYAYSATITVGSGTTAVPTLQLAALSTVTGLVTDTGGTPLAGVSISLIVVGGTTPLTGTTDSAGRYTFSVSPGNYIVRASKTGYQLAYSAQFAVGQGTTTAPTMQLAASVTGTLTGLVTDGAGNPLAGVSLTLMPSGETSATSVTGSTDSTGHYSFTVATGNYVLRAAKDGYQVAYSPTFAVTQGSNSGPTLKLASTTGYTPIGYVDQANRQMVAGWAFDQDAGATSIQARVDIDGVAGTPFTAGDYRADLAAFAPVGSPNHGFGFTIPSTLSSGAHSVQVYVQNYPGTAFVALSSPITIPAVVNHAPMGYVDVVNRQIVSGWAFDQDAGSSPVQVRVDIDGVAGTPFLANGLRTDLASFAPVGSPNHGFGFAMPSTLSSAAHTVTVCVQNYPDSTFVALSSPITIPAIVNYAPTGCVDQVNRQTVSGWAFDLNAGATSIQVRVDIDGVAGTPFVAGDARADLAAFAPVGSPNHGFTFTMPSTLSSGAHSVVVYVQDYPGTRFVPLSTPVTIPAVVNYSPIGCVDQANHQTVSGWAFDQDAGATSILVRVDIDGVVGTPFTASDYRADLAAFAPVGSPYHGFSFAMPVLTAVTHRITVLAQNYPETGFVQLASLLV